MYVCTYLLMNAFLQRNFSDFPTSYQCDHIIDMLITYDCEHEILSFVHWMIDSGIRRSERFYTLLVCVSLFHQLNLILIIKIDGIFTTKNQIGLEIRRRRRLSV